MSKGFATGWRWMAAVAAGAAVLGLAGCGGGDGDGEAGGGAFQGNYAGTFRGSDVGTWQIAVNGDGDLAGTAHSNWENLDYTIDGSVNAAGTLAAGLYAGSQYRGTYNGVISAAGAVSGTWTSSESVDSGTFAGRKN